jgi:fatty acid desaturase
MQEHFHQTAKLPQADLYALIEKRNAPAGLHFGIMMFLYALAFWWVVLGWSGDWWEVLGSQLLFGLVGCSLFACLHETAHNTAFKSLFLNRAAAFLMGILHLYPSSIFRELHFTHHRYTHIEGLDPEISLGGKPAPTVIGSFGMYLAWLTGLPLLLFKIALLFMGALAMPEPIRKKVYPFIDPKTRWWIFAESLLVLGVHISLLMIVLYINPNFMGIFVGQLVVHAILSFYLIMEHNGLPHEGNILERTRSIPVNGVVKWIMWNMPYHAEHHAYPAVPFYALPKLHQALGNELRHQTETHPAFHWKVLKGLFGGKK